MALNSVTKLWGVQMDVDGEQRQGNWKRECKEGIFVAGRCDCSCTPKLPEDVYGGDGFSPLTIHPPVAVARVALTEPSYIHDAGFVVNSDMHSMLKMPPPSGASRGSLNRAATTKTKPTAIYKLHFNPPFDGSLYRVKVTYRLAWGRAWLRLRIFSKHRGMKVAVDTCLDAHHWRDSLKRSCHSYVRDEWCTHDGTYGPRWRRAFGVFSKYADKVHGKDALLACCGCGGGRRSLEGATLQLESAGQRPGAAGKAKALRAASSASATATAATQNRAAEVFAQFRKGHNILIFERVRRQQRDSSGTGTRPSGDTSTSTGISLRGMMQVGGAAEVAEGEGASASAVGEAALEILSIEVLSAPPPSPPSLR